MKCVFCGGELEKRIIKEDVAEGSDRAVIEVAAEVCLNCHERYFPEGAIDQMIVLKEKLKEHKAKLKEVGKVYQVA